MKRKIIFLAGKTGVVSLPSKWLRAQGLKKGDELTLEEKGNAILVKNTNKKQESKYEINIENLSQSLTFRYLNTLYKLGASEIKIIFNNSEKAMDIIQKGIDSLIGLEIVRQSNKFCIVKEVSQVKFEEFKPVFRRLFLSLLSLTKDSLTAIKDKDKSALENISKFMDPNINRLYMFCIRILNKENQYVVENIGNITKLNGLEKIGDHYNEISQEILNTKSNKLSPKTLKLYEETNKIVETYYHLNYKSTKEEINELILKSKQIKNEITKTSSELKGIDGSVLSTLKIINQEVREIIDWIIL